MINFIALVLMSSLVACSTGATGGALFKKGQCIEQPWGAYTYQVAESNNETYFLYKVGYMGKEIVKLPFEVAHKEYQPINCP